MRFDLDALPQIGSQDGAAGTPLQLAIDSIDEDPLQPRREFDAEALQQLADSIARNGVLQPLSVRRHPEQPGRWILNFGARRLRASKLAGKLEIAAFVTDTPDSYDQVIENEQREGLKPLELALFVQRRLAAGESQAEIARGMGKSGAYVTYATALINAPDWLMSLYRQGRCRGLRELHELRQLQLEDPGSVQALTAEPGLITRDRIAASRAARGGTRSGTVVVSLRSAQESQIPSTGANVSALQTQADHRSSPGRANVSSAGSHISRGSSLTLLAELAGSVAEVLVDAAPAEDGEVFVRAHPGGARQAVRAAQLRLLRIVARPVP